MDIMLAHPNFKLFFDKINTGNSEGIVTLLDNMLVESPDNCTDIYLAWDDTVRLIIDENVTLSIERRLSLLKSLTCAFIENDLTTMEFIRKDIIVNHYESPKPLTPEEEVWIHKILQLMYNISV